MFHSFNRDGLPETHLDNFVMTAVLALERAQIVVRLVGWFDVRKHRERAAS